MRSPELLNFGEAVTTVSEFPAEATGGGETTVSDDVACGVAVTKVSDDSASIGSRGCTCVRGGAGGCIRAGLFDVTDIGVPVALGVRRSRSGVAGFGASPRAFGGLRFGPFLLGRFAVVLFLEESGLWIPSAGCAAASAALQARRCVASLSTRTTSLFICLLSPNRISRNVARSRRAVQANPTQEGDPH